MCGLLPVCGRGAEGAFADAVVGLKGRSLLSGRRGLHSFQTKQGWAHEGLQLVVGESLTEYGVEQKANRTIRGQMRVVGLIGAVVFRQQRVVLRMFL